MAVTIDEVTSDIHRPVPPTGSETVTAHRPTPAPAGDNDAELMDRLARLEQRRLRLVAD